MLGYAGPRPHEALRLTWEDFGPDWMRAKATKGGGVKTRIVPELIKPLLDDVAAWRAVAPDTSPGALVFPGEDGKPWTLTAYNNWRGRAFKATAPADSRIYDLRHGYASLLVRGAWTGRR
jgi:integrase